MKMVLFSIKEKHRYQILYSFQLKTISHTTCYSGHENIFKSNHQRLSHQKKRKKEN